MEFVADRKAFLEVLNQVSKAVAGSGSTAAKQNPVLTCFLLEVNEKAQTVKVAGYNDNIGIEISLPVEVPPSGSGIIAAEAGTLVNVLGDPREEFVRLKSTWDKEGLQEFILITPKASKAKSRSAKVGGLPVPPEGFPMFSSETITTVGIDAFEMAKGIKLTEGSVAEEDSHPGLVGMCLEVNDGRFSLTSSNRHVTSEYVSDVPVMVVDDKIRVSLLIRPDAMRLMRSALVSSISRFKKPEDEPITLFLEVLGQDRPSLVRFHWDVILKPGKDDVKYEQVIRHTYSSRLLEAEFPRSRMAQLVPDTSKLWADIPHAPLIQAAKSVYHVIPDHTINSIVLEFTDNELRLYATNCKTGAFAEDFMEGVSLHGLPAGRLFDVALSPRYLMEALQLIDTNSCRIGFTSHLHPVIIRPLLPTGEPDKRFWSFIMPRTKAKAAPAPEPEATKEPEPVPVGAKSSDDW